MCVCVQGRRSRYGRYAVQYHFCWRVRLSLSARSWSRTARLLVLKSVEEYSGKLDVTAPARGILASMASLTCLFGIMKGEDFHNN